MASFATNYIYSISLVTAGMRENASVVRILYARRRRDHRLLLSRRQAFVVRRSYVMNLSSQTAVVPGPEPLSTLSFFHARSLPAVNNFTEGFSDGVAATSTEPPVRFSRTRIN